jgi:tetratricopeptide (TPR) repeat protein
MADDWTPRSFDVSGSPEPTSTDIEADRAAVATLIALAKSRAPLDRAYLDRLNISVTPWVAWQMGIYAEHVADDTHEALLAVKLALWAASRSNDVARLLANMLTAANTYFRAGERDLAETMYEEILVSPLSANTSERFSAYAGMANLNISRDNFRDAAYYFDKCLSSVHLVLDEGGRQQMLANAVTCYVKCKDIGGALVSSARCKADLAKQLEKELRTEPPALEERLLIIARLHVLGADSQADALFATWNAEAAHP